MCRACNHVPQTRMALLARQAHVAFAPVSKRSVSTFSKYKHCLWKSYSCGASGMQQWACKDWCNCYLRAASGMGNVMLNRIRLWKAVSMASGLFVINTTMPICTSK